MTARIAGIAVESCRGVVGRTSNLLFLAAFQFRLDWFTEPARVLGAGARSAELLRRASRLDLHGSGRLPPSGQPPPPTYHLMVIELGWTPEQWASETYRLLHDAFIAPE